MYISRITDITQLTPDVWQFRCKAPRYFAFTPGQAADICINKNNWDEINSPFTFTNLPDSPYLEFIIKTYPEHDGFTNKLLSLKINDEFIIKQVFGAIEYKGPGVFIAGGAGITPFIAILRMLEATSNLADNELIFANKTSADIILRNELHLMLGNKMKNILSEEVASRCDFGLVNESYLLSYTRIPDRYFYLCGPPGFVNAMDRILIELNVPQEYIVKESM